MPLLGKELELFGVAFRWAVDEAVVESEPAECVDVVARPGKLTPVFLSDELQTDEPSNVADEINQHSQL